MWVFLVERIFKAPLPIIKNRSGLTLFAKAELENMKAEAMSHT